MKAAVRKHVVLGWAFILSVLFGSAETLPPLPEIHCPFTAEVPVIDGVPDEAAWAAAPVISLVRAEDGEAGKFPGTVRILYDQDFLYVAFDLVDDYVWGTIEERDGPIWNEECVEVFLNPGGFPHQYFELNISPKNVLYDSLILNGRTAEQPYEDFLGVPEWNPETLVAAASVQGTTDVQDGASGWSAEYAIPYDFLYGAPHRPPQSGDRWRVNFYRIDSPTAGERHHYAWSPTGRSAFHLPWRFGVIIFE